MADYPKARVIVVSLPVTKGDWLSTIPNPPNLDVELSTRASEVTLADVKSQLAKLSFDEAGRLAIQSPPALDVELSTRASEATLSAIKSKADNLDMALSELAGAVREEVVKALREELTSGDPETTRLLSQVVVDALREVDVATKPDLEPLRALVDDGIKGLMRSIGDAGPSPGNIAGATVLHQLQSIRYAVDVGLRWSLFSLLTTTPLDANASFVSGADDLYLRAHRTVVAHAFADTAGTMYIEQSPDNVNWDIVEYTDVPAGVGTALVTIVKSRFVRFRYVNGPAAQTVFRFAKRYNFA